MARTDNADLGQIRCDGCGGVAFVRQRKNGARLFYLNCPKCGLDQRSGEQLQRRWSEAVGVVLGTEPTEKATEAAPKAPAPLADWAPGLPEPVTEQQTEITEPAPAKSGAGWLGLLAVGLVLLGGFTTMKGPKL